MTGRLSVGVLGLGNVLMRDDALGPYVIQLLEARYDFPAGVSVRDLGTPGLDLHPHLADLDAAIIVDTVRAPGAPGEVRCYRREEILRHPPAARLSPHDPGLKEALLALELAGSGPREVLLVGVIPQDVDYSVGLGAAVQAALAEIERRVLGELERLGFVASAADPPREPDLWWESAAASPAS